MGVVEEALGHDHLEQLRAFFRQPNPIPPIRLGTPLLRALDPYLSYRKGPYAMFAVSEYIGRDRVNAALRAMLAKYGSGAAPLPTTLDLYRELQAVTPDEFQYLLRDYFERNVFWELEADRATMEARVDGAWQVTLDVTARKIVVDPQGNENDQPMDEWIEIGVFAQNPNRERQDQLGKTLYLERHRIRQGQQTITMTVPELPVRAGIDPYHLLFEWDGDYRNRLDNFVRVR
jgi:ABC-2 type transport system permease protein